ncbi:MAG: hypothetical protein NW226_21450 [Microscillaceae bacterium]|nr:hypothetical protein [Microscillaceae bacterium]
MRLFPVLAFFVNLFFLSFGLSAQSLEDSSATIPGVKLQSSSESRNYVIINRVLIEGNRKTQERIILRELDVQVGDTIYLPQADTILIRNKNKIFNTNLFVQVDVSLVRETYFEALLHIKLDERWYIFPAPIFELSDRNFNEWINTYNADLGRTNYGMRLVVENFRGRKEKLDALVQFGFTQKFGLLYEIPYIDRKQKHGLIFDLIYAQNKSIAYRTTDNKLSFIDSSSLVLERFEAGLSLTKRNAFYGVHRFEIKYFNNYVADTILRLNPSYFLNADNRQEYLRFAYNFTYDKRDIAAYPLKGSLLIFNFQRNGLGFLKGLNSTHFSLGYGKYNDLGKKFYLENIFKVQASFQPSQPYYNAKALGYGADVLRGYELYVVDGQGFFTNKNTLRYQLFKTQKTLGFVPLAQFRKIPLAAYITAYFDTGYVRDRYFTEGNQRLSNKFLYGGGLGFDLVTFYDLVLKLNYSINREGETGFYLNFKSAL